MVKENDKLIIVNSSDIPIGVEEKMPAHIQGLLHRAFSIFIYDPESNKMLIQKRAKCKYHSGGLWSNACCSHMLAGQSEIEVIKESLQRELGIGKIVIDRIKLEENLFYCGKFSYYANYGKLSENEIDNVFLMYMSCKHNILANKEEIDEYQWVDIDELTKWQEDHITDFTAWFTKALELVLIKSNMR